MTLDRHRLTIDANALRLSRLISAAATIATLLLAYCLGHGWATGDGAELYLSLVWSISHAVGLVVLFASYITTSPKWTPWAVGITALSGGLAASALVSLGAQWGRASAVAPHSYVSVSVYVLLTLILVAAVRVKHKAPRLFVDYGRSRRWVMLAEISHVATAKNYLEITSVGDEQAGLLRSTLAEFLERYSNQFLRVHRSHAINVEQFATVVEEPGGKFYAVLKSGKKVPVSQSYRDQLDQLL